MQVSLGPLSHYHDISLLGVINILFEAIIKKIVEHLSISKLPSDKQYDFCSSKSTADVLTFILHRISEVVGNKNILRVITLDISKFFDTRDCYTKLAAMESLGESPQLSFLLGKSTKLVVNGQSTEAQEINAGIP